MSGKRGKSSGEFERASAAAKYIQEQTKLRPKIALVLGSGLGAFADEFSDAKKIPYKKIPHKKVKLPKRSTKEKYDDQASLKRRKFVAERY